MSNLLNHTEYFDPIFDEYLEKGQLWTKHNKVQWFSFMEYTWAKYRKQLSAKNIKQAFPKIKFIHLRRNDIQAMAISWYCVKKTQKFHVVKDRNWVHDEFTEYVGDLHLRDKIEIDSEELIRIYERLKSFHGMWYDFLANESFLEIEYKDLIENPKETLCKALDYIGVNYDNDKVEMAINDCHSVPSSRTEYAEGVEILRQYELATYF